MRKTTQKEFETIPEIFSINYVKVLFKKFLEEGLLIKREYELLIKKLDTLTKQLENEKDLNIFLREIQ